ncbi:MAG: diguanylate cyclase [Rhodospirillaceae bacterium]|nr:MAG: diguanylate cyclase [Rhodospirillaceae bacterium]
MPVTISIGVATGNAGVTGLDELPEQAEQALYAARAAGRNGFEAAGGLTAEETQPLEPVAVLA